jgi:NADH-quinone oxidoreductase subunit N
MASIVKVGAFAALLRVVISALGTQLDTWRPILFVLVIVTCVVGACAALVQRNVKRLLAYSSINQAGFMLLGVWSGSARGVASTLFFVLSYAPVVVASFAVVTLVGASGDERHSIDHYRGLARRQPWLGGALVVLLLSQLGAPLTVGFYAKYVVLAATIDSGGGALALVAILSAAIAAVFYLRWAITLYDDDQLDAVRVAVPRASALVIALGVVVAILFGVWPGPLATWVQHATLLFLP